tara:strand:- start:5518 stop:6309 length:792 start_codon:yes stop_codon:yes gene_type:complete
MKRHVYLLGGTGNILFQVMKMQTICKDSYYICDIFITDLARSFFSHTIHNNDYKNIIKMKKISYFSIPFLLMDLMLAKFFGVTLFSVLDLNSIFVKRKPLLLDWIYFGYFQKGVNVKDIYDNRHLIKSAVAPQNKMVFHVRGGDFDGSKNIFTKKLGKDYYSRALSILKYKEKSEVAVIVTNDKKYAEGLFDDFGWAFELSQSTSALEDFYLMRNSKKLVCSNSTFSFMASLVGSTIELVIIPEFFKEKFHGFEELPFDVEFI